VCNCTENNRLIANDELRDPDGIDQIRSEGSHKIEMGGLGHHFRVNKQRKVTLLIIAGGGGLSSRIMSYKSGRMESDCAVLDFRIQHIYERMNLCL
jgi:hypothetical protein